MPEIKQNFTGGKMNKDLDERLVSNGEYRHAMNVQVSTSDNSEVGTVQNLLSNIKLQPNQQDSLISQDNICVGSIDDEKNNAVYWFLSQGAGGSINDALMNYSLTPGTAITSPDPIFNAISSGASIMEYKDNTVSPVVIEASNVVLPLQGYFQQSVQSQAGYYLLTLLNFYPTQNQLILQGMVLSTVYVIQSGWNANNTPAITNTYDFSNGANYTPLTGPSPTSGVFNPDPPTVSGFGANNSVQLSYMPDDLLTEVTAGSILAFEFNFGEESGYNPPLNFPVDDNGNHIMITGINIIDEMLFWTDGQNEPKKINIPRCKLGTPTNPIGYTRLINEERGITMSDNIPLAEQHVTLIRKPPSKAPVLDLKTGRDYSGLQLNPPEVYTGAVTITVDQFPNTNTNDDIITATAPNIDPYDFSGVSVGETVEIQIDEDIYGNTNFTLVDWSVGGQVVLKEYDDLSSGASEPPAIPITDYRIKAEITDAPNGFTATATTPIIVELEIINIDGFPLGADPNTGERKYAIDKYDTYERLFEFKFPRFATRYKYSDGEYSTYSPFTQIAFVPGSFDYHPKKGYNLGMTNLISQIDIKNFRLNDTPLDVVEIDILYKEDGSPNVYTVDTIKVNSIDNYWQNDTYTINNETIKATVPSNQLLRSWDNVPKSALAQEVTGNRIVFANYTQGWDVFDTAGNPYSPNFKINLLETSHPLGWGDYQTNTIKSIKSLREYQLGVVFIDEYGRETPVISNPSGAFEVDYSRADEANRIRVKFGSDAPKNQKYYKFYIKQTSGEYYNLAMDRWYDAEDGNVWLSFASIDRNKIDEETFLLLKKSQESSEAVKTKNRYKVLAIENEAPDYIKTNVLKIISAKHFNGTDPVFNANTTSDNPVQGTDKFTLNYNHFNNTSASKLHEIDDGDLYFTLSLTGSSAESQEYRITSITTDAFDSTVPIDPKYYIQTDRFLEDDVNFVTDDPTGQFSTEIQDQAVINIFKKKVENLPIFDGKFFVKIYIDDTFRTYISQDTTKNQQWRTVTSKKVYSMRENHHVTHSIKATGHGEDVNGDNATGGRSAYSHPFGRFACYFRRYDYGNTEWPTDDMDDIQGLDMSTSKYRFDSPSNSGTITNNGTTPSVPWFTEFYQYTGFHRSSSQYYGATNVYSAGVNASAAHSYLDNNKVADRFARKNEVWFLDMYKHVDKATASQNSLNYFQHPSSQADQFDMSDLSIGGIGPMQPIGSTSGTDALDISTGYHHFKLTLGPIFLNKSIGNQTAENEYSALPVGGGIFTHGLTQGTNFDNFFAVGTGNPNYQDLSTTLFTDRLNPGSTWRWAEDPNLKEYNITGNVYQNNILRYYTHGGYDDAGEILRETAGSLTSGGTLGDGGHFNGAQLSPNFNKTWRWTQEHVSGQLNWVPADVGGIQSDIGPIIGGRKTSLTTANPVSGSGPFGNHLGPGSTSSTGDDSSSVGINHHYIVVTQASYLAATDQFGNSCRVVPGYVVTSYVNESAQAVVCDTGTTKPHLVVRDVIVNNGIYNGVASTKIYLTGYMEALDLTHVVRCDPSTSITFAQGAMNGYSPNSAARISLQKSTTGTGAFTTNANTGVNTGGSVNLLYAVGYTMEFIEPSYDNITLPENPAIWETEPKDSADLDIYYEASDLIPIKLDDSTDSGFLPLQQEQIGFQLIGTFENCTIETHVSVQGFSIPTGTVINSISGNILTLSQLPTGVGGNPIAIGNNDNVNIIKPDGSIFTSTVESISDLELTIDAFTWKHYHTLNWYNCYSFGNGVESNRVRDSFNAPFMSNGVRASSTLEEKIEQETRKYGLIFSGIYNAVSSTNSLNQFIQAEKITKEINPIYGSIQKLHSRSTADGDLITLCEDRVLKILATKDAIFNADGNPQLVANVNVLGQAIPYAGEYGISKNPESFASESYRAYFTDKQRGAVVRLSKDGLTPISDHGMKDWFRDHLKLSDKLIGSYDDKKDEYNIALKTNEPLQPEYGSQEYVLSFKEDIRGWVSFKSFIQMESGISMASNYYTFYEGKIYQHHAETGSFNSFYSITNPSSITFLLNDSPSVVKSFKTLLYEGSQAKVTQELQDGQYYNLIEKKGWYLQNINTDMQFGANVEFIEKENKWFNYIKGFEGGEIEEEDFTYQGIGVVNSSQLQIINSIIQS